MKKKKIFLTAFLAVTSIASLASCSKKKKPADTVTPTNTGEVTPTSADKTVHTVYFIVDGEIVGSVNFKEGDTQILEFVVPKKEGYVGTWDDYTLGNKDIYVTARYFKLNVNYTVEYYLENLEDSNFTLMENETQTFSASAYSTVTPRIKTFDHFTCENADANATVAEDGSTVIKLYYVRDTYTVNYITNTDVEVDSQTVKYGTVLTEPTLEKEGYTLTGYTANDKPFTFNTPVSQDLTIEAIFEAKTVEYTVNYYLENLNDDNYTISQADSGINTAKAGSNVSTNIKTFEGFELDEASSNVNDNIKGDGSTVINVYYKRKRFTVDFITNNGTELEQLTVKYGQTIAKPHLEKQGYTYSCFKANGLDYNFDSPVTKNLVLEAFYIPSDSTSYKVEFYYENIEDDGYKLDGEDTNYGTTDSLTPITGYSIPYGFELTNPNQQETINADGSTVVKYYYKRKTYTVSFVTYNDSIIVPAQTVKYEGKVIDPNTSREGYTLTGWYNYSSNWDFENDIISNDITLTAEWEPNTINTSVEIYYENLLDDDYTLVETEYEETTVDTTHNLSYTEPEGFTINPNSITQAYIKTDGSTVFKVYLNRKKYDVSFNYIDSDENSVQITYNNVKYGTVLASPEIPQRPGYDFKGWDNDINEPITSSININAEYEGRDDTPYTINIYIADVDNNNEWVLEDTFTEYGTTDTYFFSSYYYENNLEIEHLNFWNYSNAIIKGDGSTEINLYYNRVQYEISIDCDAHVSSNIGTYYYYGKELNLAPIFDGDLAYDYLGIYDEDDNYIGDTFTFTVDGNRSFHVKTKEKDELSIFSYSSNDTQLTIYGFNDEYDIEDLVIPDCATDISSTAFAGNETIKTITLGKNVKSIEDNAFYNIPNLTTINLNDNLENISYNAFCQTTLLNASINKLPRSLKSIGSYAFYNVVLDKIEFENESNLETIYSSAFTYDSSYTNDKIYDSITIPNSVKEIGTDVFYNVNFNNLYFEENSNLEIIGVNAFSADNLLNTNIIAIPNSVKEIGDYAFYNRLLNQIVFEENSNLEIIGSSAFTYNQDYENDIVYDSITIPNSVITIDNEAFYNVNFNNLHFEDNSNLELIGDSAFAATELKETDIDAIPNSVKKIGGSTFYNRLLNQIVFEENSNLETIGSSAFTYNQDYENDIVYDSITIPNSVILIGDYAFYNIKFNNLYFEENSNLENIGSYAFYSYELEETNINAIPNSVKIIGDYAFYNRILSQIAFEENSNLETIGGSAFTYDSSYTNDKIYDSITIPNSVIEIRASAFYNIKFNNLYFEENSNLETIDSYAFSSYDLEETNINAIPNSVRTIGYSSFHNRILNQIVFEENSNLETISDSAFSCKSSYESDLVCDTITIPSSVKFIGNYAFYNVHFNNLYFEENSNLERIKQSSFSSDEPFKTNINAIPNSILEIENSAFYNRILNQIVFEDDSILEAIDPSAFRYESEDISDVICETITIPSSVKLIGSNAFKNVRFNNLYFEENSNLETIDSSAFSANELLYSNINAIPNSVKIIGDYAFYNRILNQIAFEGNSTLETIGSSAFAYDSIYTNDLVYNSITIPNSVIKIDNEAFYNVHFNNLYFEENSTLETIGGSAFGLNNKDNILISEITLPASLKNINESAFSNRTFDKFKFEDEINLELSSSTFNQCYVNEFYYNSGIKNDEYNNGFYALYADKFIIPNTITEIDNDMFQYANIKTVVFEENSTLQKIGDGAFYSCHIESIILPNSLKEIGVAAFKTCNLKTIELPENVEIIGENAFYDNSSLEILIIGESLYEIGDNAFSAVLKYVFNKSTLRLAEGEDNYGLIPLGPESYLFEGEEANKAEIIDNFVMYHESETETKLLKYIGDNKNITIPSYVTYIDDYAFYSNRIIEEVIIPDNVTFIGNNVFTSCYKLQNVVIGNGVERIKSSAFQYCKDLRTVVIGNSVTTIEQYAFYDCNHLTTITLGVNVETIETSAFGECFSLVEIHNKSSIELQIGDTEYGQIARYAKRIVTTDNFESYVEFNDDFARFNYDGETYLLYYYGEETTQLIIPDYFTIIGNYAFIYTHIESIVLGENIKELEKGAFFYSNNYLQEVIFNDKLEIIGDDAFSQCYLLTNIVLPDSVTYIGDSAFFNIKHLKITVGSGLKTIGDGAFKNSLVEFKLSGENNIETIGDEAFMNCEFTTFELGENLLSIGNDAFNGTHIYEIKNDSILNITIGSEDYGKIALNCINIYSSNDGESIITTDENGFSYINISSDEIRLIAYTGPTGSDVDLIIPEYITIIGGNVFKNVHFNNVIISKNVTRICENAFANSVCNTFTFEEGSNLKYIDDSAIGIDFTQTEFRLPDGLLEIGAYNFRYINVYTVYIPASVTKIGEGAFWNSTELKLIVFDKDCTLTELPNSAFGCLGYYDDLYVVLPTSLTLIDSDALYDYNATSYYLYYGTESDWQNVTVQNGYTYEVYYYSETEPTTEGNYWHFDENGNPVVWNSETE